MASQELHERLKGEVDRIRVVDLHEHLHFPEEDYLKLEADFARFLFWYTVDDLQSAGMVIPNLQEYKDTAGRTLSIDGRPLSLDDKWKYMKPYWEQIRFTGYGRAALYSIRKLLGIEDLNDSTYRDVSEKLAALMKAGVYRKLLSEVCGFTHVLNDIDTMAVPGAYERMDRGLFQFVSRFRHFSYAYLPGRLQQLERAFDRTIRNIDHLLDAMDAQFERWQKDQRVALKLADAYIRDIHYEDSTRDEAERVMRRIFGFRKLPGGYDETISYAEARPFENFVVHRMLDRAEEQGIPVIVHTGIQTHMGNEVGNSRALLLSNLIMKYPKIRFLLLHSGYPWITETACLAKQFSNVFLDLTWVHIIVPEGAREGLAHILDMVPVNKIHGFGGDMMVPETIWGSLEVARENVARVLGVKVERGEMTEDQAVGVAEKIMGENARAIFKLKS